MNSKLKYKILSITATIFIFTSLFGFAGYLSIKGAKDDWFVAYNIDYNKEFDILLSTLDKKFIEAGIIKSSATSISSVESLRKAAREGVEAVNDTINVKFSKANNISNILLADKKIVFRSSDFSKSDFHLKKILDKYNIEARNYVNRTLDIYEELLIGSIENQKKNKLNDLKEFIKISEIDLGENYYTDQSLRNGYWHFLDDKEKKILADADEIIKNSKPFINASKSPLLQKLEEIFKEIYSSNDLLFQNIELGPQTMLVVADYLLSMKYLSKDEKIYTSIQELRKKVMSLDFIELLELNQFNNNKPPIIFTVLAFASIGLIFSILILILISRNSRLLMTKKLTSLLRQVQKN